MIEPDARGESPSARIVDEIRRRIHNGELPAGERVPSTRQITRQWGVAMATASKVLTALRQEGLVRAVPGVGTVVELGGSDGVTAGKPAGSAHRDGPDPVAVEAGSLSRERVVRAGIRIADTEGLGALAMRRVAAELDTATMSLYRYVRSKDDLLTTMVATVFDRFPPPDIAAGTGWRERLDALCRLQWAAYQQHPWLAQYVSMTRPQLVPSAMSHTEWAMAALQTARLDPGTRLHIAVMLANFVRGNAVNLEPEAQAEQDSGVTSDEWMAAQSVQMEQIISTGAFPMFAEMAGVRDLEFGLDSLFEFGLLRLLDGIEVFLDRPAVC
jgi:AcrR family transcriptional regulator